MDNKSSSSSKKPKMEWWKIGGFTLGIVLIASAVTYALTTRNSAASSGLLDNVPSLGSNTIQSAPATMGVGDLKWAQKVTTEFADHTFIFVILQGDDTNSNDILANRVSDASAKIEARGAQAETLTLSPSDPEHSITVQRLAIGQLPAVLAISNTGQGGIMTGDITEGKLLQTYLTVSQPVCVPGGSSGCCP
jgi:hypothetical protein